MPPQANATITRVGESRSDTETAGAIDDWDVQVPAPAPGSPEADALIKWEGAARAYYRESTTRESQGGTTNVLLKRELILDTADAQAMGLDTDDVITFTVDGAVEASEARAQIIPTPRLARVSRGLQTARVRLADA